MRATLSAIPEEGCESAVSIRALVRRCVRGRGVVRQVEQHRFASFPDGFLQRRIDRRCSHLSEEHKLDEVDAFAELQHGADRDLSMQAIVVFTQVYPQVGIVPNVKT